MDANPSAGGPPAVRLPVLLVETTVIQALGTAAVLTIPALAPAVAEALGVPASLVGYQVGIVYMGAMVASLLAGVLVSMVGPCRTGQIAMLLAAAGCVLAGIGTIATIVVGSIAIGLAYGVINPAASDLLSRHSPPRRRNVVFSIKQTGVPIGGALVGLLGPKLALAAGWSAVMWVVAGICVVSAIALEYGRDALDAGTQRGKVTVRIAFAGLAGIAANAPLVCLAFASFCFSAIQLSLIAFLVVLLVEEFALSLVDAGLILAAVQVMGVVGRLTWGLVADMVGSGLAVLAGLALVMAAAAGVIALASPDWPLAVVIAALMVLGLTGSGWNGVYLSEVARASTARDVGSVTGAAMVVTFAGVLVGPTVFSAVHTALGSYAQSYVVLTVLGLAGAVLIALVAILRGRGRTA